MSDVQPPGDVPAATLSDAGFRRSSALPLLGCATLSCVLLLSCVLPLFLVDLMQTALARLQLSPTFATLAVVGIIVGSMINIPIYQIDRLDRQPEYTIGAFGVGWFSPQFRWTRTQTTIALNVGGCVIPLLIAARQLMFLSSAEGRTQFLLLVITCMNIFVCWRAARPVEGIGIMMPGLLSPLIAVGMTWLLGVPEAERAAVAFIAGIAGPLVGADLLHLRDIARVPMGVLSIGGAGTFDGIVLSGLLAALLV